MGGPAHTLYPSFCSLDDGLRLLFAALTMAFLLCSPMAPLVRPTTAATGQETRYEATTGNVYTGTSGPSVFTGISASITVPSVAVPNNEFIAWWVSAYGRAYNAAGGYIGDYFIQVGVWVDQHQNCQAQCLRGFAEQVSPDYSDQSWDLGPVAPGSTSTVSIKCDDYIPPNPSRGIYDANCKNDEWDMMFDGRYVFSKTNLFNMSFDEGAVSEYQCWGCDATKMHSPVAVFSNVVVTDPIDPGFGS